MAGSRPGHRRRPGRRAGVRGGLRDDPPRGGQPGRPGHVVLDRIDDQGDDRGGDRHVGRRGQARLGRPGDEAHARLPSRRPHRHGPAPGAGSIDPQRRPAQHRPTLVPAGQRSRRDPAAATIRRAADPDVRPLRVPERDVRGGGKADRGGLEAILGRVHREPNLRASRDVPLGGQSGAQ